MVLVMGPMMMLRPAARLQPHKSHLRGLLPHASALRALSTRDDATKKGSEGITGAGSVSKGEAPMTNKSLWDRVLANHPEQDDRANSDLLYEYPRKSYFGIMSAGSLAHIAFWSWFKGYEESLIEMHPAVTEPTFFSFITHDLGSTLGFGSSILLSFLIGFHARRAVARISVVSGGKKLRFTTHKFLGDLGQPFDVPVGNVSAHPNTKKNMILKVGKDRGFYLVDVNGQFFNRNKLESMITFRTDFTEHEKMMKTKDNANTIEVRTGLPRTDLKESDDMSAAGSARQLPKRVSYHAKGKGNLLGRKPSSFKKNKGRK